MKVAVSGKGGSGKTTVSGTLARSLAEEGFDVVAIDEDTNPNLALTLGIPRDQEVPPLPDGVIKRVETFGSSGDLEWELAESPREIIEHYSVEAPADVKLLKMGEVQHAGSGGMCVSHATGREVLSGIVETHDEVVVMDMFPGVEHLATSTLRDVDVLFVVVEPYYQSLETGRDTNELAAELGIPDVRVVANKVRDEHDQAAIEGYCADNNLDIDAVIPYDDAIRRAHQEGTAPVDYDSESEGIRAIQGLIDDFVAVRA